MPEISEILARPEVRKAIMHLVRQACDDAGVSTANAQRISVGLIERIIEGAPIQPAIDVVQAVRKVTLEQAVAVVQVGADFGDDVQQIAERLQALVKACG